MTIDSNAIEGSSSPCRVDLPTGQVNTWLSDALTMRVGVPHRSGSLAFHAFQQGYPAMISASAFWNPAGRCFRYQDASDVHELDFALDSAGFTAMQNWKRKGAQPGIGKIYPWSYEQYVELASVHQPTWWAQPDACCEKEIASSQDEVDYRVNATATMLEGTLRVLWEWQNQLADKIRADGLGGDPAATARVVANTLKPCVPVLQGWTVDDYLRSLDMMMSVWERWTPWLAPPTLIGLGSVCRRNLHDPLHGLYAVLEGLDGRLPAGSSLHLFGVKGQCLSRVKNMDWIASADSMAYDFSARVNARRAGVSNTMDLRTAEMTRWMIRANKNLQGEQVAAVDEGTERVDMLAEEDAGGDIGYDAPQDPIHEAPRHRG